MELINCNANDSSRQIDTLTKAKRKQHFSKLSHIHTQSERKKRSKSRASPTHTHTIILMTATVHSKIRTFTDKQICVYFCIVWAINLSGRRASEAITLLREETMKIVHTYTLTDALIKHGSKKLKKVKRNERHHSLDSCIQ